MVNVSHLIERCAGGRKSTLLCLNDRTTSLDRIEVLPGLEVDVVMKGQPETDGRRYLPTVVELNCQLLNQYLQAKSWEKRRTK